MGKVPFRELFDAKGFGKIRQSHRDEVQGVDKFDLEDVHRKGEDFGAAHNDVVLDTVFP